LKVLTAQSTKLNAKEAVLELKQKLNCNSEANNSKANNSEKSSIKALTFFASSNYNSAELIAAMNEIFPNTQVFGCSTAGEIISGNACNKGGMYSNSIVAMAFTDEIVEDIKVEVVDELKNLNLMPAIKSFEDYYQSPFHKLDDTKYFGLIYMDGLSCKEETILETLGDYTNVVFVGGSAGDDLKFEKTIIYANGKYYDNAAVLVLIKSKVGFSFEKIQSFIPTEHTVTATKVDEDNRIIYELDNKPAAEVYANILNTTVEDAPNHFADACLGLMIDDKPYIRSIQKMIDNKALLMYCNVKNNAELKIVKAGNIIADTKKSIEDFKNKYKSISGMLIFDCILRRIELQNKNLLDDYMTVCSDIPTVGFSTYGEALIGHINQTATFLVLQA